jgi:sugar phosphate isomerase/epimerase
MAIRSRREFIKRAAVVAAAGSLPLSRTFADHGDSKVSSGKIPFDLGMASYSFRAFTLDQALEMTRRLGLKKITLKDMHLPMNITAPEMAEVQKKMNEAGIELSSCGVVYMKTAEEIHNAFVYAKIAGIKMMVGAPEQSLLGLAEEKVKETDIALAIHNHGPTDQRFPSPESAYSLIKNMDKRMGICIDVGHTQRLGLDPASEVERFFDRLLDVHIKDVSSADAKGSTVEIGRGVIDIPKLLRTLVKLKYSGTLHFEHEKDQKDPLAGVAESVGYVRGVLATL